MWRWGRRWPRGLWRRYYLILGSPNRNILGMRRRLLQFGFFAGIANFAAFWIAAVYLGGEAISGRAVDGHYCLSNHGHLTEVSRAIFIYSEWHVRSVWVTHPIAMLCAWQLSRQSKLSA